MITRGGKQGACVPEKGFHIVCRDTRSRLQVNSLHVRCGVEWWDVVWNVVGWDGVRERIP